jgi:uncharacterized protein (DUF2141 family)
MSACRPAVLAACCAAALTAAFACATGSSESTVRATQAHAGEARRTGSGRITVELLGVESAEGQVLVALFLDAKAFPDDVSGAHGRRALDAKPGTVRATFDAVPSGPFAVSAFHDADGDGELDTNLLGIPQEGYGFSRDASAPFGPPDFSAARLTLAEGEHKIVRIRLRY